jgi:hypothetical protein
MLKRGSGYASPNGERAREALRACRDNEAPAAERGSGYASPNGERAREALRACRDNYK